MRWIFSVFLLGTLLMAALAFAEEPPSLTGFQQFYGEVRGLPAGASYSLIAKVNNRAIATTSIAADGKYGYSPTFKVYAAPGSTIAFSVFAVTETPVGTALYQQNAVTQLNFQYPQTVPPGQSGQCNNNIREGSETCDGTDLNNQNCTSRLGSGYTGTLRCGTNCQSFNTSLCTAPSESQAQPGQGQAAICWQCHDWAACKNGKQTRSCARFSPCDVQGPNVYYADPARERACQEAGASPVETKATACTINWECGSWSTCQNNRQIRLCSRIDQCDRLLTQNPNLQVTRTPEPAKERSCTSQPAFAISPSVCPANGKRCLSNELQRCSLDGKEWQSIQVCPQGCDGVALRCRETMIAPAPPTPPQKPTPTWILPLIGSVILIIVIILVAMTLLSRRKYAPAKSYIESGREKGYDDAAIRARLINQGWDPKVVDKLMK